MSRHIDRVRAQFQQDLQKIVTVQSQDRPSVRMNIADRFQLAGDFLRFRKTWKQDQAVGLFAPYPASYR